MWWWCGPLQPEAIRLGRMLYHGPHCLGSNSESWSHFSHANFPLWNVVAIKRWQSFVIWGWLCVLLFWNLFGKFVNRDNRFESQHLTVSTYWRQSKCFVNWCTYNQSYVFWYIHEYAIVLCSTYTNCTLYVFFSLVGWTCDSIVMHQ